MKTNNRFSSLIVNDKNVKNFNQTTDKKYNPVINPSIDKNNILEVVTVKDDNIFKNKKDSKPNIPKKLEVNEENFPGLVKNDIKEVNEKVKTISFLDKLNTEIVVVNNEKLDDNKDVIEEGWVKYKWDVNTGKTITNYDETKNSENTQNVDCEDVMNYVVFLHEKRKKKYIEIWGEDEYEKMFVFPNYEYGYFDRLDIEEYERNMEQNENCYSEDDYEDYDEYNEYW